MKIIDRVKFWCYKILPTVYDDSLSYYEVLCKLQGKLNEVIEAVNDIPDYIKNLIGEGEIVVEAVNEYLSKPNVVDEAVNKYLNETDTLDELVNEYLSSQTIDNLFNLKAKNATDAYLSSGVVETKVNEVLSDSEALNNAIKEGAKIYLHDVSIYHCNLSYPHNYRLDGGEEFIRVRFYSRSAETSLNGNYSESEHVYILFERIKNILGENVSTNIYGNIIVDGVAHYYIYPSIYIGGTGILCYGINKSSSNPDLRIANNRIAYDEMFFRDGDNPNELPIVVTETVKEIG